MLRIGASSHGESRLRMLRIVRRGDRHDPKDLTVSCRFEGDFAAAFIEGRLRRPAAGRGAEEPGPRHRARARRRRNRALRPRAVRAPADRRTLASRGRGSRSPSSRGRGSRSAARRRARRSRPAAPSGAPPTVTSNGKQIAVVSGIDQLDADAHRQGSRPRARRRATTTIRAASTTACSGCSSAMLSARWTYTSSDVTFGPYRQGVRAAIVETFALPRRPIGAAHALRDRRRRARVLPGDQRRHAVAAGAALPPRRSLPRRRREPRRSVRRASRSPSASSR